MSLTPQKYGEYVERIPVRNPIDDANIPLLHLKYAANHALSMIDYFNRLGQQTSVDEKGFERHRKGIAALAFLQIMAAFERYLKEVAAVCVDDLAGVCADDRLSIFNVGGTAAFPHFKEKTIGKALCESTLWHNLGEINKRFKRVLQLPSDPNNNPGFLLFDEKETGLRGQTKVVQVAFQLRHTLAHTLGLVTPSDGARLQRLLGQHQQTPAQLDIDRKHVFYRQRFLVPLCEEINQAVANRLCDVLGNFHQITPALVDIPQTGPKLANLFQVPCTIDGQSFTP